MYDKFRLEVENIKLTNPKIIGPNQSSQSLGQGFNETTFLNHFRATNNFNEHLNISLIESNHVPNQAGEFELILKASDDYGNETYFIHHLEVYINQPTEEPMTQSFTIIDGRVHQYTYNDQGIRTSKKVDGILTEYFLEGNKVLVEKTGENVIYYTYDVEGEILSMNYLGEEYFYIKNMQGDILELINSNGHAVAKYSYDAWGNIIYQYDDGSNVSNINPYRYRGYRYDDETGYYYLNSRYYDPSIARFVSADSINYLDPSSSAGLNLYAYCNNNPVMYLDSDGYEPKWISSIGGWFKDNWKEVLIGTAFVVSGAIVTGLTAGAGTTFWAAMGSALLTSTVQVGAGIAVGIGVNGLKNISKGENFFNNIGDTIASSYMWGGIFSGGSQMISGAFRSLKSTFGFNGISNNKFALGSPDKLFYDIPGATLFRFGLRNGLRIAVDTGRYGLHMHIYGKAHIWLIPEIVGVIEYFRNK